MTIILLANAGLLITISNSRFLIDGLHKNEAPPFCAVPDKLLDSIITGKDGFEHIDALLFTHTHKDHYDSECVRLFMENHKETAFICPALEKQPKNSLRYEINGTIIEAQKLPHEGESFKDVLHYGFFIYDNEESIFISGDAALSSQPILSFLMGRKPYAAALTFPFITLSRGRKITDLIAPDIVFAYHLPFVEKDVNNYIKSCERTLQKERLPYRVEILCQPEQQIII